ncbi:glycosyl hydrolase family protein [Silvibacterium acidisoli]|uniref:glycosyl hydrolase family protein n=1 Tax=Acidobacteriaceae bacterium ZG23-2 TaxID=2883246 RepID=UPI00406C22E4
MRRRTFLELSLLASGSSLLPRGLMASAPGSSAQLTIHPHAAGNRIGPAFTGLSYETAELQNPDFFSGKNQELVGLIKRLGSSGVLRLGGGTSAYSYWTPGPVAAQAAQWHESIDADTGKHAEPPRKITPLAIRNLRDFLDATGWQLIYGLNMGTGSAAAAADEAAYVTAVIGPKLIGFQLCNEPDLFSMSGVRQPTYNFDQFAQEWQSFYEVISSRVRGARLGGPDTAAHNEWLASFAKKFAGDIAFISQHYYAEGPPADPSMNIDRLMKPDPKLIEQLAVMKQVASEEKLPFRLAETNSCYGIGKPGVSNTLASALWGADLMYQLAAAGGEGINFHTGGNGWYTPIGGSLEKGFSAQPIYHGMLLFEQAGAGNLVDIQLERPVDAPLLTAYAIRGEKGTLKTVVFNKNSRQTVELTIDPGRRSSRASLLRLSAPSIESTEGITLGSSAVEANGDWNGNQEAIQSVHGRYVISMPAASAMLVTFH